jgi:hypothetical protein
VIFPGIWIGRECSITWPPTGAHFTPRDIFIWGFAKDYVYTVKTRNLADLKERTQEITEQVSKDKSMLQRARQEFECRLEKRTATNSARVETY